MPTEVFAVCLYSLPERARRESDVVPALNVELTVLTQTPAEYTGVKVEGPFKNGHHHYWKHFPGSTLYRGEVDGQLPNGLMFFVCSLLK